MAQQQDTILFRANYMKTLEEYIEYYNKHTGEPFKFQQGFSFFYRPEHGFCEYNVEETGVYIWQLCGDLNYWVDIAYRLCKRFKLPAITAFIVRSPKPFIRRLGFRITETEEKNGQLRYHAVNKDGEKLTATQYNDRFIFVWEVDSNVQI